MEKIKLTDLIINTKKNTNKNIKCEDSSETMFEFFKIQHNTFKQVKSDFSLHELSSWVTSKFNYLKQKKHKQNTFTYKKRQILLVDFGTNIRGEIAYNHPCVVLNSTKNKIFVAPCSSSRIRKVNNPLTGTIYPQYLVGETTDGFTKKTVILLDDVQWISKNRVLNKFSLIDNDFFKLIEDALLKLTLDKYPRIISKKDIDIKKLTEENQKLVEENQRLIEENQKLIEEHS